jgi:hypothetical protein
MISTVLTAESDSGYRLEVDAVTDGQASKERTVAKRTVGGWRRRPGLLFSGRIHQTVST